MMYVIVNTINDDERVFQGTYADCIEYREHLNQMLDCFGDDVYLIIPDDDTYPEDDQPTDNQELLIF